MKKNFTSQYKAYQNLKTFTYMLVAVIGILAITNVGTLYLLTQSIWVSVPGSKIYVTRAFSDPYYEENAQSQAQNFVELMYTFEPASYEQNLVDASYLATSAVFEQCKAAYYVTPDPNTREPVYMSWLKNDIIVDIETLNTDYQSIEDGLLVTYTGKQIFKTAFNYSQRDEYEFTSELTVKPLKYISDKNRLGFIITDYKIIQNSKIEEDE